jgi:hypothetical protein
MKLEDIRMKWTSGAACPEGMYLDYIYHIVKNNNKMYVSDGNLELLVEEDALKNIFTPTNCDSWNDVEFNVEIINKIKTK